MIPFKLLRLGILGSERHSRKSDEHVIRPVDLVLSSVKTAIHNGVEYSEDTGPVGMVRRV